MAGKATVKSLQDEFAPLTAAEAQVVLGYLDTNEDLAVAEAVAAVKAERCGPALQWEQPAPAPEPEAAPVAEVDDDEALELLQAAIDEQVEAAVAAVEAEHAKAVDALTTQVAAITADRDSTLELLVSTQEALGAEAGLRKEAEDERDRLREQLDEATAPQAEDPTGGAS